jgi:hypothetical protein
MSACRRPAACTDVGAHPVRDALAPIRVESFRAESFRAPLAPESLSLCVLKEKVTKEKEHPAYALCGHRATAPALPQLGHPCPRGARKVRGWVAGFVDRAFGNCSCVALPRTSMSSPALTPNWFASLRTTLRAVPPPTRRFRGAPERATRILRVLFRRARATARATFRFGFSPSAGHDGPLLYPGPLCGGETGSTGPQGHRQGCRCLFARAGCPVEKPGPGSRTCRAGARQAPSGVAFSFGYFSLGHAREK